LNLIPPTSTISSTSDVKSKKLNIIDRVFIKIKICNKMQHEAAENGSLVEGFHYMRK